MKISELEDADQLVTKAYLDARLSEFKAEIQKELGDFKTDLMKTIWMKKLSMIGIVLVGVGLLIRFRKRRERSRANICVWPY